MFCVGVDAVAPTLSGGRWAGDIYGLVECGLQTSRTAYENDVISEVYVLDMGSWVSV